MAFFNQAITVLQTLVIALGAGLGIWGVINLLEGYHKVTHKNLTDSSPLFRNSYQIMESKLDILLPKEYNQDMESKLSVERRIIIVKNRLEELRKERGIKQEELAAALEVSRQTIGSLENGRYNPSIQLAFKLSKYFGLLIEDIFIYEEEPK